MVRMARRRLAGYFAGEEEANFHPHNSAEQRDQMVWERGPSFVLYPCFFIDAHQRGYFWPFIAAIFP